jgi:hypothetical protein
MESVMLKSTFKRLLSRLGLTKTAMCKMDFDFPFLKHIEINTDLLAVMIDRCADASCIGDYDDDDYAKFKNLLLQELVLTLADFRMHCFYGGSGSPHKVSACTWAIGADGDEDQLFAITLPFELLFNWRIALDFDCGPLGHVGKTCDEVWKGSANDASAVDEVQQSISAFKSATGVDELRKYFKKLLKRKAAESAVAPPLAAAESETSQPGQQRLGHTRQQRRNPHGKKDCCSMDCA